jgi:membrane-bound serine protease (ClpP class)
MGILTIGGLISFLMGSFTLFDFQRFPVRISIGLILGVTVTTALFFIFAAGSGIKIQRKKVVTGQKGMIGLDGKAQTDITVSGGEAFVRGEIWDAKSVGGTIEKGLDIEVVDIMGNLLIVKRKDSM